MLCNKYQPLPGGYTIFEVGPAFDPFSGPTHRRIWRGPGPRRPT